MPNHVTNRLTFSKEKSEEIFSLCCPGGHLDFRALVPQPPQIYLGDTSAEDEQDFKCNWSSWNRLNWGTKWNAYDSSCGVEGDLAFIQFDTAWSVPYPVMAAFANRFGVAFEHRYFDEGHNFWGIEEWKEDDGRVKRATTRKNVEDDKIKLCISLTGFDPTKEDEDD